MNEERSETSDKLKRERGKRERNEESEMKNESDGGIIKKVKENSL